MRAFLLLICLLGLGTGRPGGGALSAQEWGSSRTRALVERAVARRSAAESEGSIRRWEALARGMVLFLARIGEDQTPPRLVKADELAVEVYWEAPGRSKQTIVAWRDRAWLPTDIQYHRDHLGIVTNDYGPLIRLGDGDEVRDVPHPLSAAGAPLYEFALVDSIAVESGEQTLRVYAVQVRPRDPARPAIVGTVYLEVGSAALVRFQFSFTRAAYREASLQDITVSLDNALYGGRHWLPWRQELEIRRRAGLVDFPSLGIIRARWVLDRMRLEDESLPRGTGGLAIDGLLAPGGSDSLWEGTLAAGAEAALGPLRGADLEQVRREVARVFRSRAGALDPGRVRPGFRRVSDLIRVNRVEGVRLGVGMTIRPGGGTVVAAPWLGFGTADGRWSGRLDLRRTLGPRSTLVVTAERAVVDFVDDPVISPAVNSILAQETGRDLGDWVERRAVMLGAAHRWDGGLVLEGGLGLEEWRSVATGATPARGSFRPNPSLGGARLLVGRATLEQGTSGLDDTGLSWRLAAEGGRGGETRYARLSGMLRWAGNAGPGELSVTTTAGWASHGTPRARGFVMGGWGTLPGEPHRRYGGRRILLQRLEYLGSVPIPELRLGSIGGTGPDLAIGPFLAAGVAGGGMTAVPWVPSAGARTVAGIAVEGLFRLVRIEFGVALDGGGAGLAVDVAKPWWRIL